MEHSREHRDSLWWPAPAPKTIPTRKIHLDYHNSEHVTVIADDFDPSSFAATLRDAAVDSLVAFAKDMHGYFYYPSATGPEHPALHGRDLFGAQVEACRSAGIKVFAYYCTSWDNYLAKTHPEWLSIKRDGSNYLPGADQTPGWTALCMSNDPFVELMLEHTTEIVQRYTVDGLWYDMPLTNADQECFCGNCLQHFRDTGQDPLDRAAQGRRTQELLLKWLERSSRHASALRPGLLIDHNQQTRLGLAGRASFLQNVDVEALPTGEWGYGYFPIMSRFVRALSIPFTGLTGRFQTSWADFGGLKSATQLRVELAAIVAAGGGISVGDQLHPSGRLDTAVYRRIGDGYHFIDEVKEYLAGASSVAEAVLLVGGDECTDFARIETSYDPMVRAGALGLAKLLVEHRVQFDVAEPGTVDLSRYGLAFLPDGLPLSSGATAEIEAFLAQGGRVIHCAQPSDDLEDAPWLRTLGIDQAQPSPFAPAYMRLGGDAAESMDEFDFALYLGATRWAVRESPGVTVQARLGEPAFQRSPQQYTSHLHTPFDQLTQHPVALTNANVAAIGFSIGKAYLETGYWMYSLLFGRVLAAMRTHPLVVSTAPASLELTVAYQADPREGGPRLLVHAVNFTAGVRRGEHLEYYDKIVPIHEISIDLNIGEEVESAWAARAGRELAFSQSRGRLTVQLPKVDIHEIIVLGLAAPLSPHQGALSDSALASRQRREPYGTPQLT